ncbi:hypothetical protein KAFR_0B00600 [Kazachstania africana CBS 2517]|uniref:VanZ-like domain-containing protein n=1 Tax=Kazachstania africana (strain ATCC 22294 / BCRC 22015 / CBS 2517 / CECT 1963 / NBRC 1671 / NRRL Y-8276) TaxID=1071382 RepID=H2APQ9_KAZAF|nr:hypothetical protein KAFR_0B00600 [Kazachstania africana CBS 2517]CCF56359.1 hypothetical protein KAFR_0B00600 [Kazachstania africana CBS 2517]
MRVSITTNKSMIFHDYDKVVHFVTFMVETVLFMSIFETESRHTVAITFYMDEMQRKKYEVNLYHLAIVVCCILAGIGSEFMQKIATNGQRVFDIKDIICNVLGSFMGMFIVYYYKI